MPAKLIEITEARRLVLERTRPVEPEAVPLGEALGRVLAEEVISPEAVPGFDNSAMDGFAVRSEDLRGAGDQAPVSLRVAGESRAGHPAGGQLQQGEAIAISTGAMIPGGADAVVRVEDTSARDGLVQVAVELEPGRNVRRAGEDIDAGAAVLAPGAQIGAAELGVLASVGREEASCARRPLASVLTTGDELTAPGQPLPPGGIRNSNAYSVPPLATGSGAQLSRVEMVADDLGATTEAIGEALEGDLAVICGGVSVGEHDHVRPALAALEVEEVFWGVALKPGKPTLFAVGPGGTLIFGLPGNPVSAMVTFLLFARPAILAMTGRDPEATRASAILEEGLAKKPGRAHAVRCSLALRADGLYARPTGDQGSHVLTSMLGADCLAMLPTESGDAPAGTRVEVELLPGGRIDAGAA